MSQLGALIWLKWTLFGHALRSRKTVASHVASLLGTLAALALSLIVAALLGAVSYVLAGPARAGVGPDRGLLDGFIVLFLIFTLIYSMWAMVPLGMGSGREFDPGRLLLYPVNLSKLFLIDLVSDLTSLASIFAVPVMLAMALGAGLARGQVVRALFVAVLAIAFGLTFSKLIATLIGAVMRKGRTRGETLLALLGALLGFSGFFFSQLKPFISKHAATLHSLWWTPPGAFARALIDGLRTGGAGDYALAVFILTAYALAALALTYRFARRAALGLSGGGGQRLSSRPAAPERVARATDRAAPRRSWPIPFLSSEFSALVEKELRYAMRNAQLRMLVLMPLILIGVRWMQQGGPKGLSSVALPREGWWLGDAFARYGDGLVATGGVLYMFLILSSFACNSFAFEEGGMRALILAPVARHHILAAKNMAFVMLALLFAVALISINQLIFHDLTAPGLVFAILCFIFFACVMALVGNALSLHFPKPMKFGKRLNLSGMAGLLLIPIILAMALPPLLAVLAGYFSESLMVKYATLTAFAAGALGLYGWLIKVQGRTLARREIEILEAVSGRREN